MILAVSFPPSPNANDSGEGSRVLSHTESRPGCHELEPCVLENSPLITSLALAACRKWPHSESQGCLNTGYENKSRTNVLKLHMDFAKTDGDLASNSQNLSLPHQEQDDLQH